MNQQFFKTFDFVTSQWGKLNVLPVNDIQTGIYWTFERKLALTFDWNYFREYTLES